MNFFKVGESSVNRQYFWTSMTILLTLKYIEGSLHRLQYHFDGKSGASVQYHVEACGISGHSINALNEDNECRAMAP